MYWNMLPVLYRPALFYLWQLCHIIAVVLILLFHSCSVCGVYCVVSRRVWFSGWAVPGSFLVRVFAGLPSL